MTEAAPEELYPMRTVASLTGINPVTLRAWERRYGLVTPRRASGGHRLYSRSDLDRLRHVLDLMEGGMSIGRAAALVARGDDRAEEPLPEVDNRAQFGESVRRLLAATESLDRTGLSAACEDALDLYPMEMVIENILTPVLQELGERWSRRAGGIAEEHFLSSFLRDMLGAGMRPATPDASGPRLLAACMPDEHHDLGLLMFGQCAEHRGYRVVMLGAAVPLEQIPPAARASCADAVILSITQPPPPGVLGRDLSVLVDSLEVPVLVGGFLSERYRGALEATGTRVIGRRLTTALDALDARLGHVARTGA